MANNFNYSITPGGLKAFSRVSGLGCRRLARRLGVSHVAVYYWMSGKRKIGANNLKKLKKLFPELARNLDE